MRRRLRGGHPPGGFLFGAVLRDRLPEQLLLVRRGTPTTLDEELDAVVPGIGRGATQRIEAASEDRLQRWWRPVYALELSLLECPAFAFILLHALWSGHQVGINGFAELSGLLMTYFGARFGVLGVYVSGRTREKQAAITGEEAPSIVGTVIKAVARKR